MGAAVNIKQQGISTGQGYPYPSIAEKYATTTLGSVKVFPNPAVEAESGWSSEIGVHQDPVSGLSDLGFKATNVEQSRIYGGEVEIMLGRSFGEIMASATGGYTYIYPVEYSSYTNQNTDIYLKYRKKHTGRLSLAVSSEKIDFGVDMYARSKTLNIDDVFLNPATRELILPGFYDYWQGNNTGYFLMDGNIGYRLTNALKVSVALKNITNTEYMGRPGDIQPQSNLSLRFSGRF